jgi:hypothetical protein
MGPAVVLTAAPAAVLSKRLRVVKRAASWPAHPVAAAPHAATSFSASAAACSE